MVGTADFSENGAIEFVSSYQSEEESTLTQSGAVVSYRGRIKVIHMPHPEDSKRKLIYCKSHWLAIMRALQFLGVVSTNYGCRQEFVDYVNRLLCDIKPCLETKHLKNIESESPFNRPLVDWYLYIKTPRMKYYWKIAIMFLSAFYE